MIDIYDPPYEGFESYGDSYVSEALCTVKRGRNIRQKWWNLSDFLEKANVSGTSVMTAEVWNNI